MTTHDDGCPRPAAGTTQPRQQAGPRERLARELANGATVEAAANRAGMRRELAIVVVDHLRRTGKIQGAQSLCSSGLGACGGGTGDEVKVHCAGCPLSIRRHP